jgi:hypothetical protein
MMQEGLLSCVQLHTVTGLHASMTYANYKSTAPDTRCRKPRHFGNPSRRSQDKLAKTIHKKARSTRLRAQTRKTIYRSKYISLRDRPLVQHKTLGHELVPQALLKSCMSTLRVQFIRRDSDYHSSRRGYMILVKTMQPVHRSLESSLPASRRTKEDNIVTPALATSAELESDTCRSSEFYVWIDDDLELSRLHAVNDLLWMVGRPMPPRALHQQRLLGRQIIITEKLDLHLVWTSGQIFVKPLPRFLFDPHFWETFKLYHPQPDYDASLCSCRHRQKIALGLLFSYAALVAHESDYHIAKEMHLIPEDVQWSDWRKKIRGLLSISPIHSRVDPRFQYGELRLSRLNKIYFFWKTPFRGYMSRWNQYGAFFRDNLAWLAGSTVYIAVVLTAMQVGLATNELQDNDAFQSAAYGFTMFSVFGPLAAFFLICIVFCFIFIGNWIESRRYTRKRAHWSAKVRTG